MTKKIFEEVLFNDSYFIFFRELDTSLHRLQYIVFTRILKRRLLFGNRLLIITSKIHTQIKREQFQNYNILLPLFSKYSSVHLIQDSHRLFYHFHLF